MTRAGAAEEHVVLWKSDNFMADYSNDSKVSSETMLNELKEQKLVYEDEIYRDEEVIRIKKEDGTIVKEISYAETEKNEETQYYVDTIKKYWEDGSGEYEATIVLVDKKTNSYTTFENAYAMYKGKRVDVSEAIYEQNKDGLQYNILDPLESRNIIARSDSTAWEEIKNYAEMTFIIIKDGKEYQGTVNIGTLVN